MIPLLSIALLATGVTIVFLFALLKKKNDIITQKEMIISKTIFDTFKEQIKKTPSITNAVFLVKKYQNDVSVLFYEEHSLFPDVFQRIGEVVLKSKTFQELLIVLGDRKRLVSEGTLECFIWKHVYYDVRTHLELLALQAIKHPDTTEQEIIDIIELFQLGVFASPEIEAQLKAYRKSKKTITPTAL